jgi:hypothetical protein
MAEQYPSQAQDRIIIRMPDGMRDKLSAIARANGRSMTAEVVHRLEQSFERDATSDAVPDFVTPEVVSAVLETRDMLAAFVKRVEGPGLLRLPLRKKGASNA